ncbi:MAG TPA: hypothetical protein VET26_04535 [Candidatus Sulfotelmatobacter sp.]|nr:hypothetical protein [Candidatus Sulfotelmatobacter sp.]
MANKTGELSGVQFQKMTEQEVWKLLTAGTGALEVSWPASDDERIDLETHVKASFGPRLSLQVKCASWLSVPTRARNLVITFSEKADRVHSHPLYWYLFGCFDLGRLEFISPLFLVPSDRVHRHADPRVRGDTVRFSFNGSMEKDSRDQWRDCVVEPLQLAGRVLSILKHAAKSQGMVAAPPPVHSGGLVIGLKR